VIGPYVQGITIDKTNFTNSNYGVYVGSPSTGGYQLYVAHSQFNMAIEQIVVNDFYNEVNIHDNLIYVPAGHTGITINASSSGSQYLIHDNQIAGTTGGPGGNTGISFGVAGDFSIVHHNQLLNLTTGIRVAGSVSNVTGSGNAYKNVNTHTAISSSGGGNTVN
jgi:hypothetical protein